MKQELISNIFIGCTSGITIMLLVPFVQTHQACFTETQEKLSWTLILVGLLFQAIVTLGLGTVSWRKTKTLWKIRSA